MNVSLALVIIMGVLYACGVYAMLERSLTRVLIGFLLLGNATNLLLLIVMGAPGIAPFAGDAEASEMSDPMPMALTLTAIVITFAVSAFLLALIYRSWQLGQADTVQDDEEDLALRERRSEEDEMDDDDGEYDEATTDFVGVDTSPIIIVRGEPVQVPPEIAAAAQSAAPAEPAEPDAPTDPADPAEGGDR
jgi:multisubunit Na+/H+ antiporter MnhC subunit